jgi:AcrR family transcriptional regulator
VAVAEKLSPRERVLETSAALFRRQGATSTGLKEIVRESGTPWGSVYHYFPDGKDQLIAESLRRTGERYAELMERAFIGVRSPGAGIRRYFNAAADNLTRSEFADGCPVGTVALEIASNNEQLRHVCAEILQNWQQVVADALTKFGIPPRPARELGEQFVTALEGALVLSRAYQDDAILRRAGNVVAAAVDEAQGR